MTIRVEKVFFDSDGQFCMVSHLEVWDLDDVKAEYSRGDSIPQRGEEIFN